MSNPNFHKTTTLLFVLLLVAHFLILSLPVSMRSLFLTSIIAKNTYDLLDNRVLIIFGTTQCSLSSILELWKPFAANGYFFKKKLIQKCTSALFLGCTKKSEGKIKIKMKSHHFKVI